MVQFIGRDNGAISGEAGIVAVINLIAADLVAVLIGAFLYALIARFATLGERLEGRSPS